MLNEKLERFAMLYKDEMLKHIIDYAFHDEKDIANYDYEIELVSNLNSEEIFLLIHENYDVKGLITDRYLVDELLKKIKKSEN